MVASFSLFLKFFLLKFFFCGSFSLCKADVAACRGEIRMKLRGKSWFDLMQHFAKMKDGHRVFIEEAHKGRHNNG